MGGAIKTLASLDGPPVVGETYLVPCVSTFWMMRGGWWPVLGPPHQEPGRGLPWDWHLDVRFLTIGQEEHAERVEELAEIPTNRFPRGSHPGRWAGTRASRQFALIWSGDPNYAGPHKPGQINMERGDPPAAELRPRLCRRPTVEPEPNCWDFPELAQYGDPAEPIKAAGGRLLCPHQKMDLTHEPRRPDGTVICPLHRLRVRCG